MKVIEACFVGSILMCGAAAQDPQKIPLTQGISVQMPVADHAVEMRAADDPKAKVVAIAADGRVFVGIKRSDPAALSNLSEETIYVKADARVSYQKLLTVLDALHGKSVVLLTAAPTNVVRQGMVPPYGMKLMMPR